MSTPLQDIYDSMFARLEKDDEILSLREDELSEELFALFKSARAKFKTIRKNLNEILVTDIIVNPGTPEEYNLKERDIVDDLTNEEIEILSYLMIVSLKERKLVNSDFYDYLGLTTKDFKQLSKANQLSAINKVVENAEKRANKMIRNYSRVKNNNGVVTTFIDEMSDL